MGLKLWLSGLIKIPAAFAIITVCYFHFWFWNTVSYIEVNPASNIYDFIVGKFSSKQSVFCRIANFFFLV